MVCFGPFCILHWEMCVLQLPAEDEGWPACVAANCYLRFVSCYVWDGAVCPCVYFTAPAPPVLAFLSGCCVERLLVPKSVLLLGLLLCMPNSSFACFA